MALPLEQIKQLVQQTEIDLDIILDRRVYELGLEMLRLYMKNTDEEVVLTDNLLTLIESYSKRIDVKALNLQIMKEDLEGDKPSFDMQEFEDNFYFNRNTLSHIKKNPTITYTRSFIKEMIEFYKDNRITPEDLGNIEDEE